MYVGYTWTLVQNCYSCGQANTSSLVSQERDFLKQTNDGFGFRQLKRVQKQCFYQIPRDFWHAKFFGKIFATFGHVKGLGTRVGVLS